MVTTYDDISAMLAELGPELDLAAVSMFQQFRSWVIEPDDEAGETITLDYDEPSGKLYMCCVLGPAPEERQLLLYDFLLQYNLCWSESGGARMGLDGPGGNVVHLYDLALHGLDYGKLKSALAEFMVTTQLMRVAVGGAGLGAADDAHLFGIRGADDPPERRIKV